MSIPSCIHVSHELCAFIWVTNYVTLYMRHELFEWMSNVCVITMYTHESRSMCVYTSHELCDFIRESRTMCVNDHDEDMCDKHPIMYTRNPWTMCVYMSHELCDFIYGSRTVWENDEYMYDNHHVFTKATNYVRLYESRTMWLYVWVTNCASEWRMYMW